jgi:hypothetical protein
MATTTCQPHSLDGPTLQGSIQLVAAPSNRLHIHSGNLGQEMITPMTRSLGLQGNIPTPLLLIQAAEKQVHSPAQFLVGMFTRLLAVGTSTLVEFYYGHLLSPSVGKICRKVYTSGSLKTRSCFWKPF